MEVSTVSQKSITSVDVYLTLGEAVELHRIIGLASYPVADVLFERLGRALDEAREANAPS